ncbi:hypothetical protein [Morganella morganii]|uniref:hypothetical protein n=1 Tax=Morganella morganii TaxID=582 RepID=UPI0021CFAA41|nr:hypothetical protein [Morganella morganii]MCU6377826.1 hypothetical protein [Morganella morganii]
MDISRQQFEEFIKLHTDPDELKDRLATINAGKNYRNAQTDIMWIAWEESRNSLNHVGYLSATASVCLMRGKQTIITPEDKGNCTPLYRLDK